ncbi:hypothetical protein MsAg5_14350 [Methanosarcinaceae archaeon Ag5]|uniref:Uncharacterized protein n=1 Tax=Methanolapillus africanus TaxID=3028297 RepID=A0AAE4SFP4_9EURY|nr:hypothetical protein [Methanosarcinaceae archaeon Ag5]
MQITKSKTLMILVTLVVLISVVGLAGCIGGDNSTNTTNNTTNATNNTTNNTTNTTPSAGSVTVQTMEQFTGDKNTAITVLAKNRQFMNANPSITTGQTLHIWNREDVSPYKHLYHSEEGVFEDIQNNPRYEVYMTFNQPGVYHIDLYNPDTGAFYDTTGNRTMTVTVTNA